MDPFDDFLNLNFDEVNFNFGLGLDFYNGH